ncbi:hypothetical protein N7T98_25730 [Pseudomonas syringae pv. tomato]|uniref:hypothetical protein n=1 Tax=Pseudomonas syringae group genomosp. 3 TaxID=251701 RepID=UPI0022A65FBF|nr:hypothetical protein [Pseudomonas syringae group genomosp. 3]MCZ0950782.1 hypothetical protein [Pseudomonas syringae pv. tomato]
MKDVKLSKNFKLSEFTSVDQSDYSIALFKLLASQLQIVRNSLQEYAKDKKKQVSISINSGVRTQADYDRLKKSGYNPSATSDHFCGLQLKSKPTLGAADIAVSNCILSLQEIESMIIDWNKEGYVDFGQIIFEYNPKTKAAWIHIGNDWNSIFASTFLQDFYNINRKKYLMSLDNGKTYKTFNLSTITKELNK